MKRASVKLVTGDVIDPETGEIEIMETDSFNNESGPIDDFFLGGNTAVEFIPSGCTLLDLVLGGGYASGRVINIVGDKSTGKTLLAIEACANFVRKFHDKSLQIWYNEAEAAFDAAYAESIGLPLNKVVFVGSENEPAGTASENASHTVEGLSSHIEKVIEWHSKNKIDKGIYIIDSIDALSDDSEQKREIGDSSYGANKAKKLGEFFRRLVRKMKGVDMTFIMISQVRDNIGVTFGETKTRSGGRALDFYSSQIIWLAELGKEKKIAKEIERVVGVNIKVKCKKNKIGLPFREADYYLQFAYGIDDLQSNINFLLKIKDTEWLHSKLECTTNTLKRRVLAIKKLDDAAFDSICNEVAVRVKEKWREIEREFTPSRKKYAISVPLNSGDGPKPQ